MGLGPVTICLWPPAPHGLPQAPLRTEPGSLTEAWVALIFIHCQGHCRQEGSGGREGGSPRGAQGLWGGPNGSPLGSVTRSSGLEAGS